MSTLRDCTFQSIQSTQESLAQASVASQQPPVHCPAADEIFLSFLAHDGTRPGEKFKLCLAHRKPQQTNFSKGTQSQKPQGKLWKQSRRALRSQEHLQQALLQPATVLRWPCFRAGPRQLRRTVCPHVLCLKAPPCPEFVDATCLWNIVLPQR